MSFGRISFILWRTTNRNRVVTSKFRSEGGRDRNGSSPGLRHGDQIYFPAIEQVDGGFMHSVASLWIAARFIILFVSAMPPADLPLPRPNCHDAVR